MTSPVHESMPSSFVFLLDTLFEIFIIVFRKLKCVLVFVPDIYDTMKEGRLKYLQTVNALQRKMKHLTFAWIAAGAQPKLEQLFNLG